MKRIKEINDEIEMKWKHFPTKMNHTDAGSRGASYRQLEKIRWWNLFSTLLVFAAMFAPMTHATSSCLAMPSPLL